MLPLQIRLTEHEATLTAAVVPYGISMVAALDFAFLVDVDGEELVLSPYEYEEFFNKCHGNNDGKFCSTPGGNIDGNAGERGGQGYAPKGKFVGKAQHAHDVSIVTTDQKTGESKVGVVGKDGVMAERWLDEDGNVVLTAAEEAAAHGKLKEMGTSTDDWLANITEVALNSMNADEERAMTDAVWYQDEHDEWGVPLAQQHGITVAQVMGIAAATSTNKRWDGIKNNNKNVVENILKFLKEDKPITITAEQAEAYNKYSFDKKGNRSTKTGGKYGPESIEPGTYKLSQLSSGTLARVMGSGYGIGGQYNTDGLFKAFAIARGEMTVNEAVPSLKQRSFANNLSHPEVNYSSTNDFWMARALFGKGKLTITGKDGGNLTIHEWETKTGEKPNKFLGADGGTTGSSSLFAMATRVSKQALADLARHDKRFRGMMIHEFQALVWVQMQREYRDNGWTVEET